MPPPSGQEVVFSLSLPLVIAVFLLLGLLLAGGGWLLARRRLAGNRQELPWRASASTPWLPALLEALPGGVLLADAQGRVRLANSQARRWLGEADRPARLPPPVQALVGRVAASSTSEGLEAPVPSGGGERLWIKAAALGGSVGVLVLIEERQGSGVDAEVYRRLMRTIAHELRTPLTAIVGHAEILASCSVEEEALWRRSQQFITREVERLARLVEDLLPSPGWT